MPISLRLARKLDEPRTIARRIATLPFLCPFDHGAKRPFASVLRVTQDHPEFRDGRREFRSS